MAINKTYASESKINVPLNRYPIFINSFIRRNGFLWALTLFLAQFMIVMSHDINFSVRPNNIISSLQ